MKDFLDIAGELDSVRENRDAERSLGGCISRLAQRDFFVGAWVRHMLLSGGVGREPTPWPMLHVEVQPLASTVIADANGTPYQG